MTSVGNQENAEHSFGQEVARPHLPTDVTPDPSWDESLRRFHHGLEALPEAQSLQTPAALIALEVAEDSVYPLVLGTGSTGLIAIPLRTFLEGQDKGWGRPLSDNLGRLVQEVAKLIAAQDGEMNLREALVQAGSVFEEALQIKGEESERLHSELDELTRSIDEHMTVHYLHASFGLHLVQFVVADAHDRTFARMKKAVRAELDALIERLLLDDQARGNGSESLAHALGSLGSDMLDASALADALPKQGTDPLPDEKRRRLDAACAAMEAWLANDAVRYWVVDETLGVAERDEATYVRSDHPLVESQRIWRMQADEVCDLVRALRTASLVRRGAWIDGHHDIVLEHLDWQGLTVDELLLVPPVICVTSGEAIRDVGVGDMSAALLSSLPVTYLVFDKVGDDDEIQASGRFHLDLGALALAHREAAIVRTTLARPTAFLEGVTAMLPAPRPKLLLVHQVHPKLARLAPLMAEVALHGRVAPDFVYLPDNGSGWGDRLGVGANPQPDTAWTSCVLSHGDDDQLSMDVTYADAMALEPAWANHVQVISPKAWSDHQVPLAQWLDDSGLNQVTIPFIWTIDDDGELKRAIVSRTLALACRERREAWHALQELAGFNSVVVERALHAQETHLRQIFDEEKDALDSKHQAEVASARAEAGRTALTGLARALVSEDFQAAPAASAPTVVKTKTEAPVQEQKETEPVGEPPEDDDDVILGEAYIDTILCTSCNECTNLNGRLFAYNGDKQAYINDPAGGTFAELVKAAELCPASCIHPGAPRPGDGTATPEMIAAAAKFN